MSRRGAAMRPRGDRGGWRGALEPTAGRRPGVRGGEGSGVGGAALRRQPPGAARADAPASARYADAGLYATFGAGRTGTGRASPLGELSWGHVGTLTVLTGCGGRCRTVTRPDLER